MINITEKAQKYFTNLLNKQKPNTQIRISVINPKNLNTEYNISYCLPETIKKSDIKLTFEKFFVYIDKISVPYLKNAAIDLINDQIGSQQLILKTPKTNKIKKPSKDEPIHKRIEYVLQTKINPILAKHGGSINLIEVTKEMSAIIQFNGGCNGCSMARLTLKEYVEKELLLSFPELQKICDSTEHQHGVHSFY